MGCDCCVYLISFYGETKCTAPKSIRRYLCGLKMKKLKETSTQNTKRGERKNERPRGSF